MACGCTSTCSGSCNNCNTCPTICSQPWTVTNVVSSLTPACAEINYCDTACAETISSDCVMIPAAMECEGNITILAGTTLTNVLNYLFCSRDYIIVAETTDSCDVSATGTITIELEATTWSLVLKDSEGETVQTITNPTAVFEDVAAGDYTVVLNGFVSIPVTVDADSGVC